jgi:hypothetical protein
MGCNGKGKNHIIGKLDTKAETKKQGRSFQE